jgi:hypothetical protein
MGRGEASLVGFTRRVQYDGFFCFAVLLWSRSCGGVSAATMTGRGWFAECSVGARPA